MSQTNTNSSLRLRRVCAIPESVRALYLDSFPADERRPLHLLEQLVAAPESGVDLLLIDGLDALPHGFMTLWTFGSGMRYIEHLATRPELRGCGIGANALELLGAMTGNSPVVIEVECPDGGIASRRISFYERCGFTLHEGYDYIQPPYKASLSSLPMKLMTRGDLGGRDIASIAHELKATVYGYKANSDDNV